MGSVEFVGFKESTMTKLTSYFRRATLVLMLASLGLAWLPVSGARAAGLYDDPQPGRGRGYLLRLERLFQSQQERFDHQTGVLARAESLTEGVQGKIDKATARGLDATAVQAALDAFAAALPAAQTAHDQAGRLIESHAGFDDKGKVTDVASAVETIRGIHAAFREFVETLLPQFRALRRAIRAFIVENNLPRREAASATPANP
jgi:hypothetical protein